MRDFHTFKRAAVRYWERRRIIYNLALIPPALIAFAVVDTFNWGGDPPGIDKTVALPLFALSALGANICYSFSYALEFVFGSDDPTSRWLRFGRSMVFAAGLLLSMFFALVGGRNIAIIAYDTAIEQDGESRNQSEERISNKT